MHKIIDVKNDNLLGKKVVVFNSENDDWIYIKVYGKSILEDDFDSDLIDQIKEDLNIDNEDINKNLYEVKLISGNIDITSNFNVGDTFYIE